MEWVPDSAWKDGRRWELFDQNSTYLGRVYVDRKHECCVFSYVPKDALGMRLPENETWDIPAKNLHDAARQLLTNLGLR